MVRILYLVHNLGDAAVLRRVHMLELGGAEVRVAGFARPGADLTALPGCISLGTTFDARFAQRAVSVLAAGTRIASRLAAEPRPDIIMARNLEMLALASRLRRWAPDAPLVYECLDIHRLMLRGDPAGRLLRAIERLIGRRAALLVTSSPAFLNEYFERYRQSDAPTLLIENKIVDDAGKRGSNPLLTAPTDGPLRIGWFGALRCRRSLAELSAFSQQMEGRVEVTLRGRPALTEFDDFHAEVAAEPHLSYAGPYQATDLRTIYSEVHFSWAIDYFEAGQNSNWLLPCRVYEGCYHGAIPIALAGTETAAFLERLGIGVVLENTRPETLARVLGGMSRDEMQALAQAVARIGPEHFAFSAPDCRALVSRLESLRDTGAADLLVPA
jgi:succinoglycan biosynthesis protein ExoL